MPKKARYTIFWSSLRHAYELHENQNNEVLDIANEKHLWLAWISQVSSFAFHGRHGSYTACKERRQRGDGYWYAYARIKGKITKRYLGRETNLSIPHLEQVAQVLGLDKAEEKHARNKASIESQTSLTSSSVQSYPLLATKFHMPRPRPRLVHRPRLINRLEQGLHRTLTLISAPVGFGKTTLLANWLHTHTASVAWLSLEPQDNEPARFLSYLLAALQLNGPHLDALRSMPPNAPSMEGLLTLLINDLLEQRTNIREHIVLVLDNYQAITDPSIHYALSFLLKHMPSQVHLVIATREDPPLPLAHLRGQDDLLELRANDLRFTPEEAATFLMEVAELPLTKEESILLHARTEGWITGLQLAAFSLQGRADTRTFIAAFSGSHHYVVDYLLEEVLHQQNKTVQEFLLQTCILERLSAPLCDAVRQKEGSQALLELLERNNLFLLALDDEGQWYRYHRLFAEALRQRLQQTNPALVSKLHARANHWYEQQELYPEGAPHIIETSLPQDQPLKQPLTAREQEVLQLLLDGISNRDIAHRLVLSTNTVKKHVSNICSKLHVHSRTQVMAKARVLHLRARI